MEQHIILKSLDLVIIPLIEIKNATAVELWLRMLQPMGPHKNLVIYRSTLPPAFIPVIKATAEYCLTKSEKQPYIGMLPLGIEDVKNINDIIAQSPFSHIRLAQAWVASHHGQPLWDLCIFRDAFATELI